MNIFATSNCPIESAENLDDKRVVKMTLETAQMICTVLNDKGFDTPYKSTHRNHPVVKWASKTDENLSWLIAHYIALSEVYTRVYKKVHLSYQKVGKVYEPLMSDYTNHTSFANAAQRTDLNISFKNIKNTVSAYRKYLTERWKHDKKIPTWRKRQKPNWL